MNGQQVFTRSLGVTSLHISGTQIFTRSLVVANQLEVTVSGAPTGLEGILEVSLVSFDGGTVIYQPTTEGIREVPTGSGRYTASLQMPPVGHYFVVWTEGLTTTTAEVIVSEENTADDLMTHTIFGQHWMDDTVVTVYPAISWPDPSRSPMGSAVSSGTVIDGAVTFLSLEQNVRYVAYAEGKGVRFSTQPFISAEISGETPGQRRAEVVEAKVSAMEALMGASSFNSDPVTTEATLRSQADSVLSARLDQLEAGAGGGSGPEPSRLEALELTVADLSASVTALADRIESGDLFAGRGANWAAP